MPLPSQPHHRRSIRLPGYDYRQDGVYFITLVTQNRQNLFGEIVGGEMRPTTIGHIIGESWHWLARQYPYLVLGEFCVMPNHFHGMLIIHSGSSADRDGASFQHIKPLGGLIGAFKTVSTKAINQLMNSPGAVIWQRNYYEHVVRSQDEFERVSAYIIANPLQWDQDAENPSTKTGDS